MGEALLGDVYAVTTKKWVISSLGMSVNLALEADTSSFMKGSDAPNDGPAESSTIVLSGGPATKRLTREMTKRGSTSSAGPK